MFLGFFALAKFTERDREKIRKKKKNGRPYGNRGRVRRYVKKSPVGGEQRKGRK